MRLVLAVYHEIPDDENKQSIEYVLELDEKCIYSLSAGDGEPEDNNLYRNFSDMLSIPRLAVLIAENVKNGCTFEVEEREWGTQWN